MAHRTRSAYRPLGLGLLAAALIGCEAAPPSGGQPAVPPPPSTAPASGPAAGGTSPGRQPDPAPAAGAPGPAVASSQTAGAAGPPLIAAEASAAGVTVALSRDGSLTLVDPGAAFRVEIAARVADARLVLLDAQESLVPASGTTEVGSSTRFTLVPAAPLRAGGSYTLRLDGVAGRELHDDAGRGYRPLSMPLRATGQPPAPSRAKKRGKRQPAPGAP